MKRIAAWIALICLWIGCAEGAFAKPVQPAQQDDAQQEPKTVQIPDTATEVFYEYVGERSVSAFEVSPDHPTLTSVDGVLFSKDGTELISYPRNRGGMQEGEVYRIPDGTKRISESAFYHCRWGLTVVVPDSVEEIHPLAFWGGDVTLRVGEGSYAQRFAEEENIDYVIGE